MTDRTAATTDGNVASILHAAARAYATNGVAIFPCRPRDKRPASPNGFHDATTDLSQIDRWWTEHPDANIGIALGVNRLFALDVDGPDGQTHLHQLEDTYQPLPPTYQVVTGRPEGAGRHHIYRQPADVTVGNTKLGHPQLETRGDGGYIIAPPSIHPSGTPYQADGKWGDIADPPGWLVALATRPADPAPQPPVGQQWTGSGDDPAAARRLEGACGKVAMSMKGNRNATLFWAACVAGELVAAGRIDRDRAIAMLTEAARRCGHETDDGPHTVAATISSGLTTGSHSPDWAQPREPLHIPPAATLAVNNDSISPTDTHSWTPVAPDAYLDGTWTPPKPTHLTRNDGTGLFYPDRINLLFGESETGKGWIALHAVAQACTAGQNVLYIDFEDYADTIYHRLLKLGVPGQQLRDRLAYIRPDHALDDDARQQLSTHLNQAPPALVILDGVTGAMSMHGLDTNVSTDVDRFYSTLGEPLARAGAAVVFIDHIPKSNENAGKGPIGSQHKRARVSGASYKVDPLQPIAPGRVGRLLLKIDKDRLGALRSIHPTVAGTFVLDSTGPVSSAVLYAPDDPDTQQARHVEDVMEEVSRALEGAESGQLTKRALEQAVTLRKGDLTLDEAVRRLVETGHVVLDSGPRNALIHRLVSAYRNGPANLTVPRTVPASPTVPRPSGDGLGGNPDRPSPASPTFTRWGTGDGRGPGRPAGSKEIPL